MKKPHIMNTLLAPLLALLLLAGAGDTDAQADDGEATTRELVEAQLVDLKARLNLTDYQWSQVEMILKSSIRERVAIARRYGLDGDPAALADLERKDKRAMRKELKECREETEDRMKRYLDKEQYKEFKAVQEEIHEEMLARAEQA